MTPRQLIIAAIIEAQLTVEDCNAIQNTLREKRRNINSATVNTIKYTYGVGTRVETFGLRPQYVNGKKGVIKGIKTTRCTVKFDEPLGGKFGMNRTVTVPLSALKIVEPPPHIVVKQAAKPLMDFAGGTS